MNALNPEQVKNLNEARTFLAEQQTKYPHVYNKLPSDLKKYFVGDNLREERIEGQPSIWFGSIKNVEGDKKFDCTFYLLTGEAAMSQTAGR